MDRHTDTPEFQSIKKITKKVAICAPSHNFVGLYYYYYYYYYKKKRFRWHYVKMTAMTPYNAKTVTKCECDAKCEQSISSQPRHVSTIGKNLLNINISSTCCHNMMNFDPVMAEIGSGVWGIPANRWVLRLAFVTAATSLNGDQPDFARCLANTVSWSGTLYTQ